MVLSTGRPRQQRTHGVFFRGAGLGLRDGDFAFFFAGVLLVATICAR
jgi:hypothetical protein